MKLLVHVGMPKCASSALQMYLSSDAFHQIAGDRFGYGALLGDGRVLSGEGLREKAAVSPYGYYTSHNATDILSMSGTQRRAALARLRELGQQYGTLVLSSEGWGPRPGDFGEDCLFAEAGFDVTLLAYVRPQVEWMNSAWWQWGAWTKAPLPRWVKRNQPRAEWYSTAMAWQEKSWVSRMDVRLLEGDVVQDFMGYLGYSVSAQPRSNQSLPAVILRLLQRNRQLRPGPHDSAIEFVLARQLQLAGSAPWVIEPKLARKLLSDYREDNEKLLEILPPEQQQLMRDDPRWWSGEAYKARQLSDAVVEQLHPDELEQLAVAAIDAVNRLDGEVRNLRKALAGSAKVAGRSGDTDSRAGQLMRALTRR